MKKKKSKPLTTASQNVLSQPNTVLVFGETEPLPGIYGLWSPHSLPADTHRLATQPRHTFDSIYCPFSVVQFHLHEIPKLLASFRQLLKSDGFVHIRTRDIDQILQETRKRGLGISDVLYQSAGRSFTVHEMLYGDQQQPVHCAFSLKSLVSLATQCGFPHVYGGPHPQDFEINLYAFPSLPVAEFAQLLGLPDENNPSSHRTPSTGLGKLTVIEAKQRATEFVERGDLDGAIALYQDWIAASRSPLAFAAYFNIGCLQGSVGNLTGAAASYQSALQLRTDFLPARANLGATHEKLGNIKAAIHEWETVCQASGDTPSDIDSLITACNNLGRVYELQKRYAEAESRLTLSLKHRTDQPHVIHHLVHLRQRQCAWPIYPDLPGVSKDQLVYHTSALSMLSATSDPSLQLATARRYIEETVPVPPPIIGPDHPYSHERIRIGYLSSNFGRHAVSILTAELFELHDKSKFEVFGFSTSPSDGSTLRQRVESAMEHFINVDTMSDRDTADTIRQAEIDILIDLQGLTLGVRPAILAHRPAPIQVTYLGFPGSTGSSWIDYVLADPYLIPPDLAQFYTEKPLNMPDCFQVNDRQREIDLTPSRQEHGLPEGRFVFCAFNNNYKITPELFEVWLRILKRTPGSLLWLLSDNPWAKDNLIRHAVTQGVPPERLVFGGRIAPAKYLARYRLADLFLDTFPFNGGTTVSDSLWAGLPVLTCSGRTFASRMAGSLLMNVGLPELVSNSFDEYEEKAVHYALQQEELVSLRARLASNIITTPLFDTPKFVSHLENKLSQLVTQR